MQPWIHLLSLCGRDGKGKTDSQKFLKRIMNLNEHALLLVIAVSISSRNRSASFILQIYFSLTFREIRVSGINWSCACLLQMMPL